MAWRAFDVLGCCLAFDSGMGRVNGPADVEAIAVSRRLHAGEQAYAFVWSAYRAGRGALLRAPTGASSCVSLFVKRANLRLDEFGG